MSNTEELATKLINWDKETHKKTITNVLMAILKLKKE